MARVNKALASLPWVEKHSVNFEESSATILVKGDWDKSSTLKAITDLGFSASVK